MTKFALLPIGESFEFQGETYIKTGPLTAANQANNKQRMIPRSALIKPISSVLPPAAAEKSSRQVPEDLVLQAFENYHKGCMEWLLLTEEKDSELASRIRKAMDIARQRFLSDIQQL